MLIRSIINGDVQTFQEEFEARMAEKLAEAINVLSIVEAKKLLLGKEKDEDSEDDLEEGDNRGNDVAHNRKLRKARKNANGPQARYHYDRSLDRKYANKDYQKPHPKKSKIEALKDKIKSRKMKAKYDSRGAFGYNESEDLEEAHLLLKQNKRARKADISLQKGAIRGEPTSNLKGYRTKTKYYNSDTVKRFRKNSGWEPLGKTSETRDKINAIKARNPKRLPEEELGESRKRIRPGDEFDQAARRGEDIDGYTTVSSLLPIHKKGNFMNRKVRKSTLKGHKKYHLLDPDHEESLSAKSRFYRIQSFKRKYKRGNGELSHGPKEKVAPSKHKLSTLKTTGSVN